MKKLFLIAGLVIALTFGGGFNGVMAKPNSDGGPVIIKPVASVSIEEVACTCGCGKMAINCGCASAVQALKDAGFTAEDVIEYNENNQSV